MTNHVNCECESGLNIHLALCLVIVNDSALSRLLVVVVLQFNDTSICCLAHKRKK